MIIKQTTVLCNLVSSACIYAILWVCVTINREMTCLAKVCALQVLYICLCEYTTNITCLTSDTKTVKLPVCLFLLGSTLLPTQRMHLKIRLYHDVFRLSLVTLQPPFHSNEKWKRREYHSHLRAGLASPLRPGSP